MYNDSAMHVLDDGDLAVYRRVGYGVWLGATSRFGYDTPLHFHFLHLNSSRLVIRRLFILSRRRPESVTLIRVSLDSVIT